MLRRNAVTETALTVARSAYDAKIQYPAASLAYYAFVSLLPLLMLLLAVVGDPVIEPVRAATFRFLTPEAKQLVSRAVANSAGKFSATVFAACVLVWSVANVTTGVETVVARVEASSAESAPPRLRDAVSTVVSVGLGFGVLVAASRLFVLVPRPLLHVALGFGFLVVALAVVFLPLYYVPTSEISSLAAALPGSLTVAFGWTVLTAAVRYYVANAAAYAVYGVLSGILLVLTSFYVAAALLMLGFVVNATLVDGAAGTASS
jgi:membrane protein